MNTKTILQWSSNKLTINVSLALSFVVFLFFSGCAPEYVFETSTIAPAAEGSVKVSKDQNDNYEIDLRVIRLVDPQRLIPARNYYVAWMVTDSNGSKNIGQLRTSSGFLSKTLKSSLETVTPFEPVGFFITAEDNHTLSFPSGPIILRTSQAPLLY